MHQTNVTYTSLDRINHLHPLILDITTCYSILQRHLGLINCLSALVEFGLDDVLHLLELK